MKGSILIGSLCCPQFATRTAKMECSRIDFTGICFEKKFDKTFFLKRLPLKGLLPPPPPQKKKKNTFIFSKWNLTYFENVCIVYQQFAQSFCFSHYKIRFIEHTKTYFYVQLTKIKKKFSDVNAWTIRDFFRFIC